MNAVRPDRLKLLLRQFRPILDRYIRSAESSGGDFGRVEDAAGDAISRIRPLLVSAGLAASAEEAPTFCCPNCARPLSAWSLGPRTIGTAQGDGSYPAVRYRCNACNQDHYPIEEANGLEGDQFTTGAKGVIGEAAADAPYAHVCNALREARSITVSAKEVDRTARETAQWRRTEEERVTASVYGGEALAAWLDGAEAPEPPPQPYSLDGWDAHTPALISVDGGMVRSTTAGPDGPEWFECRAGMIATADEKSPGRKLYVGGVATADALFDQLGAAWQQCNGGERTVLFIADGATWIWDRAGLYFPSALELLDIYHAGDHVGKAARACWGEGSTEAKLWVGRAREMLLAPNGPKEILRSLTAALRQHKAGPDGGAKMVNEAEFLKEFRYLWTHRHRMWYARAKAMGLPVGSGAVESGIKQLIIARLRQAGMKWTRQGADAVMRLRCARLSGNLDGTVRRRQSELHKCLERYQPAAA